MNEHSPTKFRIRIWHYFAIVALAFLLWVNFTVARSPVVPRCVIGVTTCTKSDVFAHDPYCRFDPVCLSPKGNPPTIEEDNPLGTGQGLAIMSYDPELVTSSAVSWLANDNFWRFTGVAVTLLLIVYFVRIPRAVRIGLTSIVVTWCVAEYWRWFEATIKAASMFGGGDIFDAVLPLAYILPGVLALVVLYMVIRQESS